MIVPAATMVLVSGVRTLLMACGGAGNRLIMGLQKEMIKNYQ
jgi:hypothetical protein